MLKVNLKEGRTLQFDLQDEQAAYAWMQLARDHAFQTQITGLTIVHNGMQYALPRPVGFDPNSVFLFGDVVAANGQKLKGGERIIANAGDVGVVLMVHAEQKALRVDVRRQGKQRYNPLFG